MTADVAPITRDVWPPCPICNATVHLNDGTPTVWHTDDCPPPNLEEHNR